MSNIHALSDVSEIARLRRENENLRRWVARNACESVGSGTCWTPGTCTGCQAIAAQAASEGDGE